MPCSLSYILQTFTRIINIQMKDEWIISLLGAFNFRLKLKLLSLICENLTLTISPSFISFFGWEKIRHKKIILLASANRQYNTKIYFMCCVIQSLHDILKFFILHLRHWSIVSCIICWVNTILCLCPFKPAFKTCIEGIPNS